MHKLVFFSLFSLLNTGCTVYQTLRFGGLPKQKDYKHFPQRHIANEGHVFDFFMTQNPNSLTQKIGVTDKDLNATNISLDSFVNLHKTIAFMIIRNDSVLYESYKRGYTDASVVSSFSMVKPIVSTLIGIAIDEGKIHSIDDCIVQYLPEFRGRPGWERITIKHLLHHTSGIKFTDKRFSLTSDNAEFYWGHNLRKEMVRAEIETEPDVQFKYSSENTLLLGYILEKVTGGTVSAYFEEKLWKPLGMEASASWSLDRKDDQAIEKVFCCLQARAIDFAKFGRLYLHNGNWQGKQIVSKDWVSYSTKPDPAGNNRHFYNNNWGIGPLKYGSYFAVGLYGQYLYVYPEKNVLILRFGEADTNYRPNYWQGVFLQIIDQL